MPLWCLSFWFLSPLLSASCQLIWGFICFFISSLQQDTWCFVDNMLTPVFKISYMPAEIDQVSLNDATLSSVVLATVQWPWALTSSCFSLPIIPRVWDSLMQYERAALLWLEAPAFLEKPCYLKQQCCQKRALLSTMQKAAVEDGDSRDRWLQTKEEGTRYSMPSIHLNPKWCPVKFQRRSNRLNLDPVRKSRQWEFNWERRHANLPPHQRRLQLLQTCPFGLSVVCRCKRLCGKSSIWPLRLTSQG